VSALPVVIVLYIAGPQTPAGSGCHAHILEDTRAYNTRLRHILPQLSLRHRSKYVSANDLICQGPPPAPDSSLCNCYVKLSAITFGLVKARLQGQS